MGVLSMATPPASPRDTPRAALAELSGPGSRSPRSPLRRALSVALFRNSFNVGSGSSSASGAKRDASPPKLSNSCDGPFDSPKRAFRRISLSRPSPAQPSCDANRLAVLNCSRRHMPFNDPNAAGEGSGSNASSPAPGSASPASCSTDASLLTPATTIGSLSPGTPRPTSRARRLSLSIQHRLSHGSSSSSEQNACRLDEGYRGSVTPQHAASKQAPMERKRMSTFTAFLPDVAAAAMSRRPSSATERSIQLGSSVDIAARRRLVRRSSDESFQCRGLDADDSDSSMSCRSFPSSELDEMNTGLGMFDATPKRNPIFIAPSATERMSHFTLEAQQSVGEDEGLSTKAPAAFLPALLGLRRKSAGRARNSLMRAPLADVDTNIPTRPRRPDSFYFISPSPSSISSFSHEHMLDADENAEDEGMHDRQAEADGDADIMECEHNLWSPTCLPTPPSSIRLRLAFAHDPAGSPTRRSSGSGSGHPAPQTLRDVFIANAASALELKELISERLSTAQGFLLSPRQLSLSIDLPYAGAINSAAQAELTGTCALGLDLNQRIGTAEPITEPSRKELDNDDLLYQQGLVDDDTVLVQVRPIYSKFI